MLEAALLAFSDVFSKPLRGVLWKTLGITIALLVMIWFAMEGALGLFVDVPYPWLDTLIAVIAGLGVLVGLVFLVAPISSLVAGLFVDEIAETVERVHYPGDPAGNALPLGESIALSAKFTGVVILVNLGALILLLIPGVNFAVFFLANAYLLGREYFELAAMRFRPALEAKRLRRRHGGTVMVAGMLVAGLLSIPIANLLTPLFATAFMVHLHKRLPDLPVPATRDAA
ncbi:MAG TPA: sulfate transporter family protein [Hyphomicrobiales bacterium]|nr:sulfate transporter family protein [Hyphomicrobiales bacterium]